MLSHEFPDIRMCEGEEVHTDEWLVAYELASVYAATSWPIWKPGKDGLIRLPDDCWGGETVEYEGLKEREEGAVAPKISTREVYVCSLCDYIKISWGMKWCKTVTFRKVS